MVIPGHEVIKYVSNFDDLKRQVQPAGVDLTISKVYTIDSALRLGRKDRVLPSFTEVKPSDSGWWFLKPGVYKVRFNEVVSVPEDTVALCFPRSTLLRSGVILMCTVWDPGYRGRGEALMHIINPNGLFIERGASIAQLVFLKLTSKVAKPYRGYYQGENLE